MIHELVALVCLLFIVTTFLYIHLKKKIAFCVEKKKTTCVFLCVFTVQDQICLKNPFQGSFSLSSAAFQDMVGSAVQPVEFRDTL